MLSHTSEPAEQLPETISTLPGDDFIQRSAESATRNRLALLTTWSFALSSPVVLVGGLFGKFPAEVVMTVTTANAAAYAAVAYFYFRRDSAS